MTSPADGMPIQHVRCAPSIQRAYGHDVAVVETEAAQPGTEAEDLGTPLSVRHPGRAVDDRFGVMAHRHGAPDRPTECAL